MNEGCIGKAVAYSRQQRGSPAPVAALLAAADAASAASAARTVHTNVNMAHMVALRFQWCGSEMSTYNYKAEPA
jgi:hypothetical protein